ncbi:MAG TPA: BadF/BadG/BcrA/BcrD ATPase family protein [Ktedonobacteraceae bacterium]|nr:BadF/BadG/BcrA/BcrD ATPase family protein [Ktedonobacteraceae bacterium]
MTIQSPYYLAVDGGGTKTLAIIVDAQGQVCGQGTAGGANAASIGQQKALNNIKLAVEAAIQDSDSQLSLQAAWFGLAGVDRDHEVQTLMPHLQPLAHSVRITNDAELALGGLDEAIGIALIAGTGSIALGIDPDGKHARAGGWGHAIGDEGSGFDIGRQGLQAATQAADGRGEPTLLLQNILRYWKLDKPEDIIGRVYPSEDKAEIARLSVVVFQTAREGDQRANQILEKAAQELARAVLAVYKQLDFPNDTLPLALAGGLLVHELDYQNAVLDAIRQQQITGQIAIVEHPALSAAQALCRLSHIAPTM